MRKVVAKQEYAESKIVKQIVSVHERESHAAVGGAEEKHENFFASKEVGAAQDSPINPENKSKEKYEKCVKKTFPDCPMCNS